MYRDLIPEYFPPNEDLEVDAADEDEATPPPETQQDSDKEMTPAPEEKLEEKPDEKKDI